MKCSQSNKTQRITPVWCMLMRLFCFSFFAASSVAAQDDILKNIPQPRCKLLGNQTFERHFNTSSFGQRKLRIPWRHWFSSKMVHAVVRVVLEDMLGYAVEYYETKETQWRTWAADMVEKDRIDIDVELWTLKQDVKKKYILQDKSVWQVGYIGYEGRSGVFVPQHTIDKYPLARWYKFWTDPALVAGLRSIPSDVTAPWAQNAVCLPDRRECSSCPPEHGGFLCDSTGRFVPIHCRTSAVPCLSLLHRSPDSDKGWVEQLVVNHKVLVNMHYYGAPVKGYATTLANLAQHDYLVYGYLPDPILIHTAKLTRVSFPDWVFGCEKVPNTDVQSTDAYGPISCDFITKPLHVVTRIDLGTVAPRAAWLLTHIAINTDEITAVMLYSQEGGGTLTHDEAACLWVYQNLPKILSNWVPPCVRRREDKPLALGELYFKPSDASCEAFGQRCLPGTAPGGQFPNGTYICNTCPPGRYQEELQCRDCDQGYAQSAPGKTACDQCPIGYYGPNKAMESCIACSLGNFSNAAGRSACAPCVPGTFAAVEGLDYCVHCPAGSVSMDIGSTGCDRCSAGQSSVWGGYRCQDCEKGRYQNEPGSSECRACPKGATCPESGMVAGLNKPGYWIWDETDRLQQQKQQQQQGGLNHSNHSDKSSAQAISAEVEESKLLSWEMCFSSAECLSNEQCVEGQAGFMCLSCLPGNIRSPTDLKCQQCPPPSQNIAISAMIFFVLTVSAVCGAFASVMAASRSKAIYSTVIKLLLNYLSSMNMFSRLFSRVLLRYKEEYADVLEHLEPVLKVLDFDGTFYVESVVWKPVCMFEPRLSEEQLALIDVVRNMRHSEFFHADKQQALEALRDFHRTMESDHLTFSIFLPVIFIGITTALVAAYLLLHVHCHGRVYRAAEKFYTTVRKKGFNPEHMDLSHAEWLTNIQTYDTRVLGIWRGVDIAKEGVFSRNFWKHFFHGMVPVHIVSFFILYGTVLRSIMRPLTCVQLVRKDAEEVVDSYLMSASVDLQCFEGSDSMFALAIFALIFWGLGVPLIFFLRLRSHRESLLKTDIMERWGFLYIGFELQSYYWEIMILVRKAALHIIYMVSALNEETTTRVLFLLLAVASLVLHLRKKPFDNRYDEILDTMETRHLLIWVLSGLLLQVLYLVRNANIIMVVFVAIFSIHCSFVFYVIRHLLSHVRNHIAEYVTIQRHYLHDIKALHSLLKSQSEGANRIGKRWQRKSLRMVGSGYYHLHADHIHDSMHRWAGWSTTKGCKKCTPKAFGKFMVKHYLAYLHKKPYICMDPYHSWITLCGNHGDRCIVPYVPERTQEYRDFADGMPWTPNKVKYALDDAEFPKHRDQTYLCRIISEAINHIVVDLRTEVFSVHLLEFVMRAGFCIKAKGSRRETTYIDDTKNPHIEHGHANHDEDDMRTLLQMRNGDAAPKEKSLDELQRQVDKEQELERELMTMEQAQKEAEGEDEEEKDSDEEEEDETAPLNRQDFVAMYMPSDHDPVVKPLIDHMFKPSMYYRGLVLPEFQINLLMLQRWPSDKLQRALELFEARWHQELLDRDRQKTEWMNSNAQNWTKTSGHTATSRPPEEKKRGNGKSAGASLVEELNEAHTKATDENCLFDMGTQTSTEVEPIFTQDKHELAQLRWERFIMRKMSEADYWMEGVLMSAAAFSVARFDKQIMNTAKENSQLADEKVAEAKKDFSTRQIALEVAKEKLTQAKKQAEQSQSPKSAGKGKQPGKGKQNPRANAGNDLFQNGNAQPALHVANGNRYPAQRDDPTPRATVCSSRQQKDGRETCTGASSIDDACSALFAVNEEKESEQKFSARLECATPAPFDNRTYDRESGRLSARRRASRQRNGNVHAAVAQGLADDGEFGRVPVNGTQYNGQVRR